MNTSEDIHDLTESIYKNLSDQFTPAVRQLLQCAKAYHKALHAASVTARAYIESLGRLGHHCRTSCQGGTEEIGEAIFRIAEIQKEVQLKFEDCNKALFAEVVIPLEQKLDNDFKNAAAEQKKYHGGHKGFHGPYTKAQEAHRKFLKKHIRSRTAYDEDKEMQLKRTVDRCQNKLDEFRVQGLKLALLEERKCYCFVLARLSSVSTTQLYHHSRGTDLLKSAISGWKQLCGQPNILPRSADPLLHVMQDSSSTVYTVYSPNEGGHSPYRHIHTPPDLQPSDYSLPPSVTTSSAEDPVTS
ncbi:BAR/IMD domain-containing adapter protein 2-like [Babylonia areolata]|uniref:BAR/IMD domain-containing adapter protein 2-like n=1 Tax=Babylonia areolata TaxID=304850 RepID=UPI003FD17632